MTNNNPRLQRPTAAVNQDHQKRDETMKQLISIFRRVPFIRHMFIVILPMVQFLGSGCAIVGPRSVSQGRLSYAEAINQTADEQMLLTIVKGRYSETMTLLDVSSVAANMRFRASASTEMGFGDGEDYLGNLVPFSAGVAYEENPTITYQPIQGEQYFRQLMVPIPLDVLLLILRSETQSSNLFTILVNRANNLRNPDFLEIVPHKPNLRWTRFIELYAKLRSAGIAELVENPKTDETFNLFISDYAPAHSVIVAECLELLDLSISIDDSEAIIIPISFSVTAEKAQGIGVITRSVYDLFEIMKAAIVVPQAHAEAGLARTYPPVGLSGQDVKIPFSKTKPDNASLAVRYRGYWFYIDETDQSTKGFFALTRILWSFAGTSSDSQSGAPVLTIPVSR